jgi:hypothetical protein
MYTDFEVPMDRKLIAVALLLGLAFFAGCQKSSKKSGVTGEWPGSIALTTDPLVPVANQHVKLVVAVQDKQGHTVTDANVKASLEMKSMNMGKNDVNLNNVGNGIYQNTTKFTMAGPWEVVVTASANGTSGTKAIPLVVNRQ